MSQTESYECMREVGLKMTNASELEKYVKMEPNDFGLWTEKMAYV